MEACDPLPTRHSNPPPSSSTVTLTANLALAGAACHRFHLYRCRAQRGPLGGTETTDGGVCAARAPHHALDARTVLGRRGRPEVRPQPRHRPSFRPSLSSSLAPSTLTRSDRKDHGPFGAYDGWLGETVHALALFGEYAAALDLVRAMAPVYDRGPGGQSHQVFSRNHTSLEMADKAAADQQYLALSGSVVANRVITSLFGVAPPLALQDTPGASPDPKTFLADPSTPRGFDGSLSGVRIRGKLYTVTSTSVGLSIRAE